MNYEVTDDWIYLDIPKQIAVNKLNANWNQKMSMWRIPNTLGALREVYQISKDDSLVSLGQEKKDKRDKILKLKTRSDAPGDKRLRPYQRVDVDYLKQLPAAGIFNQQRTGKTPTALTLLNEKEIDNVIIVCPASLILNWKEEVEEWTNLNPIVSSGTKKKREELYKNFMKNTSIIISYETLRNDMSIISKQMDSLKKMDSCVIVDEAHRLRNHKTKQSKALFALGRMAKYRYALTGTPTVKNGSEVFGILHFLYPDKFPGYWQFVDRYFEVENGYWGKNIGDYKRKEELEEVISLISTNRKRSEVMEWLPKKQYQTIRLDMNKKQKKAYKEVLETFEYEENGELKVDAPSVLAQLTRLRQITTSPELLDIEEKSAKEEFILEWLQDNPGESVVIFSTFTSYLKKLQPKIKEKVVMIHGEMSAADKQESARQFQQGKARILLANTKSAGTGFTLDKGTTTIFIDKEYNPTDNEQASDRIIPTSKERNHSTTILSLVCKESVDEAIEMILKDKKSVIDVVNNSGVTTLKRLFS